MSSLPPLPFENKDVFTCWLIKVLISNSFCDPRIVSMFGQQIINHIGLQALRIFPLYTGQFYFWILQSMFLCAPALVSSGYFLCWCYCISYLSTKNMVSRENLTGLLLSTWFIPLTYRHKDISCYPQHSLHFFQKQNINKNFLFFLKSDNNLASGYFS